MENRRTYAARRALIAALVAAAGCQAPESPRQPDRPAASAPHLGITQTNVQGATRYVVCAEPSCAVPTPKNAARPVSLSTSREKPKTSISREAPADAKTIDIPFAFNQIHLQHSDRLRMHAALSTKTPVAVTVIGRSDATGTPAAKLKVAQARAAVIRAEVLAARPGAAVTVEHEIATVSGPKTSSRAYQRRATVHVTPSSHQP